ncbi:hypothetical protein DYU11_21010 [Fibrisoma montanum]|uniref:Uncharacterized protein n=1 Tax=Fibrisoma montanum TaxID=2305895 RepID=A0A418M448_9BACT|nr:DUF6712 family protein [Fibrisoma montanum]RIV20528.1 hypothetical protein DYU11_21010 [Fibrisoma montanum]
MGLFTGDTEQFRQYVAVNVSFTLDDVLPQLESTQETLLPRFLGDTLTEQLISLADEKPEDLEGPENRKRKRALHLIRVAVARIGFAEYLPFAEVQIGDDGITVPGSPDRKAAYEYQTKKLERALLEVGWRSLDELITLVSKNPDEFPGWDESPYADEFAEAIFKTPEEFSRFYPIQDRWLTFWALRPYIRAVEDEYGGSALVRLQALPETVTDTQKKLIRKKLLRAMAYQTMLEAIPNLSIEVNGVNVQVNYGTQFGNAQYFQPPGRDELDWVLGNLRKQTDLAWSTFSQAIDELMPPTPPSDQDGGAGMASTDAVVLL